MKKNLAPIDSTMRTFKPKPFRKNFPMVVCWLTLMGISTLASGTVLEDKIPLDLSSQNAVHSWRGACGFLDELVSGAGIIKTATPKTFSTPIPKNICHDVYSQDTNSFRTDVGEPLPKGMAHTLWRLYVPTRNERVVLNTYNFAGFGSELDTVLVVYRFDKSAGVTGFKRLKLIVSNDDKKIPGNSNVASQVQFDAVKGERYAIQVGYKKFTGFETSLTGFMFPPQGGLSMQPLRAFKYNAIRKFFESETYIVHNSTSKTLRVKASTSLGTGITLPEDFTLAPGAAAVKTFTKNNSFDITTVRTVSGELSFSGYSGTTLLARTVTPMVLPVPANPGVAAKLTLTAKAQFLSNAPGQVIKIPVTVKNTSKFPALGCYVTHSVGTLQTAWTGYNPVSQKVTDEVNVPFNLAAGQSKNILVAMRTFGDRFASGSGILLLNASAIDVGCANSNVFPNAGQLDIANNVDFNSVVPKLPKVTLLSTLPSSGILDVPVAGKVFTATFHNDGTTTIQDSAKVSRGGNYNAAVCTVKTTDAACLASVLTHGGLSLNVPAGKNFAVKVAVKPKTSATKFDPEVDGVQLYLEKREIGFANLSFTFGGTTKALRKK
ncbi:hypothetical protein CRENPOLYSF2_1810003 [Crenothrix polyspora]|uniref:Uncharacterized protein n=1 Tax=Crenothrix polyspora TaxID=360316 RepID=A0A1R4H3C8_9GAMM|nr:hypothetical protein [Crenothrix polyspora]SJM90743.1 hypothetical protein CRENPOLYSF2_1810003 [Crenothrix polyspora]